MKHSVCLAMYSPPPYGGIEGFIYESGEMDFEQAKELARNLWANNHKKGKKMITIHKLVKGGEGKIVFKYDNMRKW